MPTVNDAVLAGLVPAIQIREASPRMTVKKGK
jgi:hypothetical protein